jgi:hypothetical protein
MRKGFSRFVLSVMLVCASSAGVLAQSNSASSEQTLRKEKAQIIVVSKKERNKQQPAVETKRAKTDNRS